MFGEGFRDCMASRIRIKYAAIHLARRFMISCPTFTTFTMLPETTMKIHTDCQYVLCGPLLRCTHTYNHAPNAHRRHRHDCRRPHRRSCHCRCICVCLGHPHRGLHRKEQGDNTHVRACFAKAAHVCMMVHCEHAFALCHATLVALARTHSLLPTRATHALAAAVSCAVPFAPLSPSLNSCMQSAVLFCTRASVRANHAS